MTSLQNTPGVTPYPDAFVERYRAAGLWGERRIEDLIGDQAADRPDAPAIVDAAGTTTYRELMARASAAAEVLQGKGIGVDDNLVLQMPNTADALVVLLACFRLGARPVLALSTHRATEVAGFIEDGQATAWVLGDLVGVQPDTLSSQVFARLGFDVPVIRWPGAGSEGSGLHPARQAASADELAFFQLSGGTTGASKLIPRAHREYAYSFLRSNELCGIDSDTVLVTPLPVTHNFPLSSPGVFGVLSAGGCVVLLAQGDPTSIRNAVRDNAGTHLIAVPPLVQALLDSPGGGALPGLRRVLVGGARLSPAVARRVQAEMAPLQQVYGMAEGLVCYTDPDDDVETIVTTQGRPMSAHDELRVVDPETGRVLGPNEPGELQVRGPYTIRGYYRPTQRALASFTDDGFYSTGDLVQVDETRSITVVGRTKEQINRGGEKIAPVEVEDALLRHPGVHDVCVIGEPDDVLGERVVAFVIPRRGAELDRRGLRKHLIGESLAAFKIPDRFHVVDALPTTAVGKVSRRKVSAIDAFADLAEAAGLAVSDVEPDEDLFGLGIDSVRLMSLVEVWRDRGADVAFEDIAACPTVADAVAVVHSAHV